MTVECPAPGCGREFNSEEGKNSHVGKSHPSLERFHRECENCGDEFRSPPSDSRKYCSNGCYKEDQGHHYCTFRLEAGDGYPAWWVGSYQAKVHSLVAIANGAEPRKVFGRNGYHVDHINGCRIDNRPENLQVIDWSEHGEKSRPLNVTNEHMNKLRIISNFIENGGMTIKRALAVSGL